MGVALAFGLTVVTMAYAVGHISGAHFNPAVTLGLWAGGRFPAARVLPYIIAQVIGGIAAAAVLYGIASGKAGFDATTSGFAPLAIGLTLTIIHLVSIPVTNTSVNPARSIAAAVFQGTWALDQLWMFCLIPSLGGIAGGLIYRALLARPAEA